MSEQHDGIALAGAGSVSSTGEGLFSSGRCLVIGEIAQSHDGSLGTAHAFVDAVAAAGADAIKFQTHIADAESTPEEPWRVKFSRQDDRRIDYWRRMEFSESQWAGLKAHADEVGIRFLSSPFSLEAVELLERIGMPAWKIASGEISNLLMLERIAKIGQPVILSSGMSPFSELDAAVAFLEPFDVPLAVMQCTSAYPCPAEKVGINVIGELQQRYELPVGLSDHSGTIFPALAAATLGAQLVEVHVAFSREMFGPDVAASVTTSELATLVEGIRFNETMRANPVDKDAMAAALQPLRDIFMKSIAVRAELPIGHVIKQSDLTFKKPGTGILADQIDAVIGRSVCRVVAAGALLRTSDLEG